MSDIPLTLKDLIAHLPQTGHVHWISVRPERRTPVIVLDQVEAIPGKGLVGDRYRGASLASKRQVTLIQYEHLLAVASMLGRETVDPALVRRNIVVRGINLLALKNRCFRIGDAILETTGGCEPCSRMEEVLGPGGYNAMRGHGGITTRVIQGGLIRLNDPVIALPPDP